MALLVHAAGEDDRVQHHYIGHSEERDETAADFRANGAAAPLDFKKGIHAFAECLPLFLIG